MIESPHCFCPGFGQSSQPHFFLAQQSTFNDHKQGLIYYFNNHKGILS